MSGPEETNSAQPDNAPEAPAAPSAPPSFGQPGFAAPQPWDRAAAPGTARPWWFQDADDEPAPDPAVTVDEVAIQRTTPVVPPTPGTRVAGPGIPPVDTRRAIPPEPIAPAPNAPWDPHAPGQGTPATDNPAGPMAQNGIPVPGAQGTDGMPGPGVPAAGPTAQNGTPVPGGQAADGMPGPGVPAARPTAQNGTPVPGGQAADGMPETGFPSAGAVAEGATPPFGTRIPAGATGAPTDATAAGTPIFGAPVPADAPPAEAAGIQFAPGDGPVNGAVTPPWTAGEGETPTFQFSPGEATPMLGAPIAPVDSPITGTPVPSWAVAEQVAEQEESAEAAEEPAAPADPAVWSAERLGETGPIPLVAPTDQPFQAFALEAGTGSEKAATLFSPHSGAVAPAWRTAEGAAEQQTATAVGLAEPRPATGQDPFQAWPPAPHPAGDAGGPPPPAGGQNGSGGNRRLLVVGGGLAGALLIGAVAFAGIGLASGSSGDGAKNKTAAGPTTSQSAPTPARPSASAPAAKPTPSGPSIDSAATDTKPLTLSEVFPDAKMPLGGKNWSEDKTSVNHDCSLTARGAMAQALTKAKCSSVVRATWVSGDKKFAVTAGVAIMPTKAAAQTAAKAGNPSAYEWFRGMIGKVAKNIDTAGGFAASTVLGRYIVYSYAQYVDGTKPQATDTELKSLTHEFIDYAQRPIAKRSH